jgi:hypothetical protein
MRRKPHELVERHVPDYVSTAKRTNIGEAFKRMSRKDALLALREVSAIAGKRSVPEEREALRQLHLAQNITPIMAAILSRELGSQLRSHHSVMDGWKWSGYPTSKEWESARHRQMARGKEADPVVSARAHEGAMKGITQKLKKVKIEKLYGHVMRTPPEEFKGDPLEFYSKMFGVKKGTVLKYADTLRHRPGFSKAFRQLLERANAKQ